MSVTLNIENFASINLLEQTTLSADIEAGVNNFGVTSAQGYAAGDFLLIGRLSGEGSELVTVQSAAATSLTLTGPTKFRHAAYTSIHKLFGDQIKVYVAPNIDGTQPADSAFTALTGGLVSIDPDQSGTTITDPSGDSGRWYKYTYRNSVTSAETNLANSGASRGGGYATYCSVDDIKEAASLQDNRYIADGTFANKRTIAQAEIDSELNGLYVVPFTGSINPLIADITARLAAGLILSDHGLTSAEGATKLKEARDLLNRIKSKDLVLTDVTGVTTNTATAGTVSSWPNATTQYASEEEAGGERLFRISHRY